MSESTNDSGAGPAQQPSIAQYWNEYSHRYDAEPDHGLSDEPVRSAWRERLRAWLPEPARVLDVGCGTGSLALLLAEDGHRVVGVDLSPDMVAAATAKCTHLTASNPPRFLVGDAAQPPVDGTFDAVIGRHLLWTLPEPRQAVHRWVSLVRPGGTLVLIEGRWGIPRGDDANGSPADRTERAAYAGDQPLPWGSGVGADQLQLVVAPYAERVSIDALHDDAALWGHRVDDERYALVAALR